MRLYTICAVVLVAASVQAVQISDKEKRRAQAYSATPSPQTYSTVTSAPTYVTSAAPAYSSKLSPKINYVSQPVRYEQQLAIQQPQFKLAYSQPQNAKLAAAAYSPPQQQFSYSFEVQPELKLALQQAQAQAVKYNLGQNSQVKYVQPDVKYLAVQQYQPDIKYVQPQQEVKYAVAQPAALAKVAVPAPAVAKINYPQQAVTYSQPSVQPHYSPANTVSSFSFNSPHVAYSNLGLLSQVIGKGYNVPQAAPQQVAYVPQAQTHYVTQNHAAQPVQYVASHQGQQSTQQVVYVPQGYTQKQHPGVAYA